MDPLTTAARSFIRETERVWAAPPRPGAARVLRMEAPPDDRGDLVKTLRWMEWSPQNRWPLFLYEAPFTTEAAWCDGLCEKLRADYDLVRKGAAEEGVALPAFEDVGGRASPSP